MTVPAMSLSKWLLVPALIFSRADIWVTVGEPPIRQFYTDEMKASKEMALLLADSTPSPRL